MNWAPVLAATIALLGGLAFYRWQRTIDRESESLKERREAYRLCISAAETISAHIVDSEGKTKNMDISSFRTAFSMLQILSPPDVFTAALNHRRAMQDVIDLMLEGETKIGLSSAFTAEVLTYEKLLEAMRLDNVITTQAKLGLRIRGMQKDPTRFSIESIESVERELKRMEGDRKMAYDPRGDDPETRAEMGKAMRQYYLRIDVRRMKAKVKTSPIE